MFNEFGLPSDYYIWSFLFCFLPFWHELILPHSLARCIYFVLGLKILGLWQNSSWHIYVIYNITLYLSPHWLWFCGALNTSFSHFLNRFRCKVFIPFDQILCELKRPKLRTRQIPKYFLPFEIFAMLSLWSTWLDNWYHLNLLIIIINSVIDMFPLSHLFSSLSPIMNIFLLCATQIPAIRLCSQNLLWKLS